MKLVYEIKNNNGMLKDECKAFVLGTDEELTIKVEGANIPKCYVLLSCGDASQKFSVENLDELTIPKDILKEGTLNIKILQFNRTKVKTICLEPITIISEEDGFKGVSAFDELEARVKTLEEQVKKLLPLVQDVAALYSALEQ